MFLLVKRETKLMGNPTDYEQDFYAWALHNAQLLRQGKLMSNIWS